MKRLILWSRWGVATKILIPLLALSVVSITIIGYIAFTNLRELGDHAMQTSTSLGESAIRDSTAHLNRLGENIITQKAGDVAKQVEMYLAGRADLNPADLQNDAALREIVVQPVGTTGYTTLIDPDNGVILIHKFPAQEKEIRSLKDILPSFWELIESTTGGAAGAGYYDWLEVDGSITEKYASIAPVIMPDGNVLTLWATTYIDEFSQPAEQTKKEINAAILESSTYIDDTVSDMQNLFILLFVTLIVVVIVLALLLSRVLTRPILALKQGADEIGRGKLDYKLNVTSQDELGDLANSFNKMSADLKTYIEELKSTAAENIAKERTIRENLRLYMQQVSQAQEDERKRIARELHDDTVQALVVISRQLDDLASGTSDISADDIREEVRKVTRDIRQFSHQLRPSILDDLGLIPALKWLATQLDKNYGITVKTKVTGEQRPLPAESELMLFRIVQEALTNVRKHSRATEVTVTIDFSGETVTVVIEDNGRGFNVPDSVEDLTKRGKLGLVGIQERAQLLGGTVTIESRRGKGTRLTIAIATERP